LGGGTSACQCMFNSIPPYNRRTSTHTHTLLSRLSIYIRGAGSDVIGTTAVVAPICKCIGVSNILSFLAAGMALGPNGIGGGIVSHIQWMEMLANLAIVFFLFEMGLHINFDMLVGLRRDILGLGLAQVACTAGLVACIARLYGLPPVAAVVLGGGLTLSSLVFVLQLLKDNKGQLEV
jgi:Kef-type K+ transport system membrane component KefB